MDKPKDIKYSIRMDEETEKLLIEYCIEKQISKGEAIRQAIKLLLNKR